jgi:hypothetical protein
MSRNYQMHDMKRDEAERFDAYDRAQEAREAMAREREEANTQRAKLRDIDDISRPLSSCEIAQLRSRGHDV